MDGSFQKLECTFDPKLVPELLNGEFRFLVPSYQRGYRWGDKEIKDLLEDLWSFVKQPNSSIYFLQPIVVRPIERNSERWWEVLDGQQRLTTMLLVLKRLITRLPQEDQEFFKRKLYRIEYANRPALDFNNPNPELNLDAYHASNAKSVIDNWVKEKLNEGNNTGINRIAEALFHKDSEKKVSFIWYSVQESTTVKDSIGLFNRLNKGKIRLTGSELVKALFVLANKKKDANRNDGTNAVARFSLEWDEIVRKLQDDSFWYLISNNMNAQTRMDVLLTFVTGKGNDEDAYRAFQKAYDDFALKSTACDFEGVVGFDGKKYDDFTAMWDIVTRGFDDLMRWYEDVNAYNYVGWLVRNGWSLKNIKCKWDEANCTDSAIVRNEDHCLKLREAIRDCLKVKLQDGKTEALNKENLAGLLYSDDKNKELIKKILLLFNAENARAMGRRFQFDRYENEGGWDLEHVDSQTENPHQKNEEKIDWIGFVLEVLSWMKDTQARVLELRTMGKKVKEKLEKTGKDEGNEFEAFYKNVVSFFSSADDEEEQTGLSKDGIGNLTLLDASTNRSYKNAPFPYKRYCIITREKDGGFVPECTKNLFLKYYSDSEKNYQQIDLFRWSPKDQGNYYNAICERLADFI